MRPHFSPLARIKSTLVGGPLLLSLDFVPCLWLQLRLRNEERQGVGQWRWSKLHVSSVGETYGNKDQCWCGVGVEAEGAEDDTDGKSDSGGGRMTLSGALDELLLLWLLRHGVRVHVWGGCRGSRTGVDSVGHGATDEGSPGARYMGKKT
jgi:hypothetical protein